MTRGVDKYNKYKLFWQIFQVEILYEFQNIIFLYSTPGVCIEYTLILIENWKYWF